MSRTPPRTITLATGKQILIRCAEASDAAAFTRFQEHMPLTNPFQVTLPGEHVRTPDEQAQWLADHADNDGWLCLIAEPLEDGRPSGEVVGDIMFRNNKFRRMAHHGTFGIGVHGDYRGKGIGTALIEGLLDWAAAHPAIQKVCLSVFADNRGARVLYRRLGFVIEGRSSRHFRMQPGVYHDDINMAIFVKPGLAPARYRTWSPRRPV
jgi:RimJ/RimL family protein N-acetyltransferase